MRDRATEDVRNDVLGGVHDAVRPPASPISGPVKRRLIAALAVVLNVITIYLVISTVVSSIAQFDESSFTQNVENIRTLTDSSANKVELVVRSYADEVAAVGRYVSEYQGTGMTLDEARAYFADYYKGKGVEWQLIEGVSNVSGGPSTESFDGILLGQCDGAAVTYNVNHYPALATTFSKASADALLNISYANEFTDPWLLEKSFAVACVVRLAPGDTATQDAAGTGGADAATDPDTALYRTLMMVVKSTDVNQVIASNNNVDSLDFFDYANVVIDDTGDYVFSNEYFPGTNFFQYIEKYDSSFTSDEKEVLLQRLQTDTASEPVFYKNNRGKDCIYTVSSIQGTQWYILSVVPIESFHNVDDYSVSYTRFFLSFMLLFVVDVALVLAINRQLRHKTKEAQAANVAKSRFLSSMSHDIRTPMNAIIGMSAIAEENLKSDRLDVAELQDCVKTIQTSGNHLLALINDVLEISKIESGAVSLALTDFSLSDATEKMLDIMRPQAKEKGLALEAHVDALAHEFVHADALRINQVYINILSNAVKYTGSGGTVAVELREEELPDSSNKARFVYRVSDTGIGMDADFQKVIFDRFSRAVDTRINVIQGAGLGMAITKQLVDLMDGTIEVESELGVGSVFTVTLDLDLAATAARPGKTAPTSSKKTFDLRVLVAEDNQTNWKVMRRLLEQYGIAAVRADNGREALDQVRDASIPFDLVLMDIQMPVMNGYEATEAIRALSDPARAAVPIYALTADIFDEDVARCLEKGMCGHLSKPIEVEKLRQVLARTAADKAVGVQ